MNGICLEAFLVFSLRSAGNRSTSEAACAALLIAVLQKRFQTRNKHRQNAFRPHASFGDSMHSVVVLVPAAAGFEAPNCQVRLHDYGRPFVLHGVGNIGPKKTSNFVWTYDFISDVVDRGVLIGILKPSEFDPQRIAFF